MLTDANFLVAKSSPKYYCEKCDYKCSKKSNFDKHCETKRHKMLTNANFLSQKVAEKIPYHFMGKMCLPPTVNFSISNLLYKLTQPTRE